MLTNETQQSIWVAKETERALNYKKIVIPIKIDEVVLNDSFEFYLSSNQIIAVNCFDESSEQVQSLLKTIKMYTGEGYTPDIVTESKKVIFDTKRNYSICVGTLVHHNIFGVGKVKKIDYRKIYVEFDGSIKLFRYPDAFIEGHLYI